MSCVTHRVLLVLLDTQVLMALKDLLVGQEKELVCVVLCVLSYWPLML